jgi:hypothetical protein
MHRKRASESFGNEEPHVMEKGKRMLNLNNQANYEESHITKCRSGFTTLPLVPLPEQYRCGSFVGGA